MFFITNWFFLEILNKFEILGYGIVDGSLEKCEIYLKEDKQLEPNHEDETYEKYKCKHLRGFIIY